MVEQPADDLLKLLDEGLADLRAGRTVDVAAWRAEHPEKAAELVPLYETMRAVETAVEDWKAAATLVEKAVFAPVPALPATIGRYRIQAALGAGGMGTVYKGHDPDLDRVVAIKVPHFVGSAETQVLAAQRFLREARAAARIRHPHVCPIFDVGEHEGRPFVVMSYIDGRPLSRLLKTGPLPRARAVTLTCQIADALDAVHAAGIVHRDVKSSNILLDAAETPYLTDFGLARGAADQEALTQTGALVGTPGFMAPEQSRPDLGTIGPWTDVFGLGMVLYQALTGRLPFEGPALQVMYRMAYEELPAPTSFLPEADAGLDALVARATTRDPAARYRRAGELAQALREWLVVHAPAAAEANATAPSAVAVPVAPTNAERTIKLAGLPGGEALTLTVPAEAKTVNVSVTGGGRGRRQRGPRWRVQLAFSFCIGLILLFPVAWLIVQPLVSVDEQPVEKQLAEQRDVPARIVREGAVKPPPPAPGVKRFDVERYLAENTPKFNAEQRKIAQQRLRALQHQATRADLTSADMLNTLLAEAGKPPPPHNPYTNPYTSPYGAPYLGYLHVPESVLKNINVTSSGGANPGLLRHDGRLTWPSALKEHASEEIREAIEGRTRSLALQVRQGKVDPAALTQLRDDVASLDKLLLQRVTDISPSQYLEAKRFVKDLQAAHAAIAGGDAKQYFDFRDFVAGGKRVDEVVDYIATQKLRFAPATGPNDESAYYTLQSTLTAYDITRAAYSYGKNPYTASPKK